MNRRAHARMVTRFDETGANRGSATVVPGREAERMPEGWTWKEGILEGRLNCETGRINKLRAPGLKKTGNRIEGIPEGAKVIVHGKVVRPGDPGFDGSTLTIEVEDQIDVRVVIQHPLHEFAAFDFSCCPTKNGGGHRIERPFNIRRIAGYEQVADGADQRDALIKVVAGLLALLTEEQLATIDGGARETIAAMIAVKTRIPKPAHQPGEKP